LRVLIIGSGPVGSHAYLYAVSRLKEASIFISSPLSGEKFTTKLFSGSHLIYKDTFGGLQPNWHQVIDCGIQDANFQSMAYDFLNEYIGENFEFIPYLKHKQKILPKSVNLLPKSKFISDINDTIKVKFIDGSIGEFDYVLVCHGALPVDDVLVDSKLAKLSGFVSDHLIMRSRDTFHFSEVERPKQIRIGMRGFIRSYDKVKVGPFTVKQTLRQHYGKGKENISNSVIYAENKYDIIFNMMKNMDFTKLLNAFSLRYGFPNTSNHYYKFYQMAVNDIYYRNENNILSINTNKTSLVEDLKSRLKCSESIFSGIHYFNTYSSISGDMNNRGTGISNLALMTPQYKYEPSCHHFTADLMRRTEYFIDKIGKSISCV
jgi:hypothetical protein